MGNSAATINVCTAALQRAEALALRRLRGKAHLAANLCGRMGRFWDEGMSVQNRPRACAVQAQCWRKPACFSDVLVALWKHWLRVHRIPKLSVSGRGRVFTWVGSMRQRPRFSNSWRVTLPTDRHYSAWLLLMKGPTSLKRRWTTRIWAPARAPRCSRSDGFHSRRQAGGPSEPWHSEADVPVGNQRTEGGIAARICSKKHRDDSHL